MNQVRFIRKPEKEKGRTMTKLTLSLIAVLLALSAVVSCELRPEEEPPQEDEIDTTFTPDVPPGGRLISKDGWHLVIEYRLKGTRSEGQHGRLYHGDQEITGREGDEVDTPLGRMKHYGEKTDPPWKETGWNYADKTKIKCSSEVEGGE